MRAHTVGRSRGAVRPLSLAGAAAFTVRRLLLSTWLVLPVALSVVLAGPAFADGPTYAAADLSPAEQAISRTLLQTVWPETAIDASAITAAETGVLLVPGAQLAVAVFGGAYLLHAAWKAGTRTDPPAAYTPCGSATVCVQAYNLQNREVTVHSTAWQTDVGFTAYTAGKEYTMYSDGTFSDGLSESVDRRFPYVNAYFDVNACSAQGSTLVYGACVVQGNSFRGNANVTAVRTFWFFDDGQRLSWPAGVGAAVGMAESKCIGAGGANPSSVFEGFSTAAAGAALANIPVPACPAGTHRIGYNATDDTTGVPVPMVTTTFPAAITDPSHPLSPCLYGAADVGCRVAPDQNGNGCHYGPFTADATACSQSDAPAEAKPQLAPNGGAAPAGYSPPATLPTRRPDPRRVDPITGDPLPEPSPSVSAEPSASASAPPAGAPGPSRAVPGQDPIDVSVPGVVPGDSDCVPSGWSVFNPLAWVYKPVKCALKWAFVPAPTFVSSKLAALDGAFTGTAPGQVITAGSNVLTTIAGVNLAGDGSCQGLPIGPIPQLGLVSEAHMFSTCTEPLQTGAAVTRAFLTVGLYLSAGFAAVRMVASSFGIHLSIGNRGADTPVIT